MTYNINRKVHKIRDTTLVYAFFSGILPLVSFDYSLFSNPFLIGFSGLVK